MKHLKQKQLGFAHVEVLIVIVVLVAIGFVGLKVLKKNGVSLTGQSSETSRPEQNAMSCQPKDEHQWYRTDATFVVNPKDPQTMYVNVEYKGFYKSTDGGNTWAKKVKGIYTDSKDKQTGESCYTEFPAAVIDPANPQRLLLATAGSPGTLKDLNSRGGGIYETTDGGDNWKQKIRDDMNAYATQSLILDPKDSNTYYYGTTAAPASYDNADPNKIFVKKGIIYRTKNNGKSWEELPTGFVKNDRLTKIFIDPNDTKTITALSGALDRNPNGPSALSKEQTGIIRSTDDGQSWRRIGNLPAGYEATYQGDMAQRNGKNIFVVSLTQGGEKPPKSFYSTDGGNTFDETGTYMDFARYDPNDSTGNTLVGYAWQGSTTGPVNSLFRSTNAGKTWTAYGKLPSEITNIMDHKTRVQALVWHPTDPKSFFLTGAGGNVWKTSDNGATWAHLLSYDKL